MSPRLVTFHGFLGAPSLWRDTFAAPALSGLAVDHRWLPGHGPVPWLPPGVDPAVSPAPGSFEAIVDAVAVTLPPAAVLLGYSLGARLALGLAARHPQRVAGAIVIGGHPGLTDATERRERRAWDDAQADALARDGLVAFADRWATLPIFATQAALPAAERERQQGVRRAHQPAAVAWAMRALGLGRMPACGDTLAALAPGQVPPITLLTGALDDKFTALARAAAGRWPHARAATIAGAGHNVPLEAPVSLSLAVREALDRLAAAATSGRPGGHHDVTDVTDTPDVPDAPGAPGAPDAPDVTGARRGAPADREP